ADARFVRAAMPSGDRPRCLALSVRSRRQTLWRAPMAPVAALEPARPAAAMMAIPALRSWPARLLAPLAWTPPRPGGTARLSHRHRSLRPAADRAPRERDRTSNRPAAFVRRRRRK